MGRFGRDDRGRSVPECLCFNFTHSAEMLDNVFSTVAKQCWHNFGGARRSYVDYRDTKNVVVAEVKYVRKNVSDRKAEASNGYVAGDTGLLRLNEEIVFLQKNQVSVYTVSDSEFV